MKLTRNRIAGLLLAGLAVPALVVAVRTGMVRSRQVPATAPSLPALPLDGAPQRLAQAIRIRTISFEDPTRRSPEELQRFHEFIRAAYPRVHESLHLETAAGYSLLFRWEGARPEAAPVVLMGHFDVVPADEAAWKTPPFDGRIDGDRVHGRGAIDDKNGVLGILEAVEALLKTGFRPDRTIYLSFGHDEELNGDGARAIAELLRSRGIRPAFVLDEGGAISVGMFPPVAAPLASVGVAEKGYLDLELTVKGEGGHSSTPPPHTAIGILSRAIHRLEERPFPHSTGGAFGLTIAYTAPEMSPLLRMVVSNLWLTGPVVTPLLAGSNTIAALLHTTQAVNVIEGGGKSNVLPAGARAVVNYRLLPGDSDRTVLDHARRVIGTSEVRLKVLAYNPASPISPPDAPEAQLLQRTIRQLFPRTVFTPILSTGATDARHFTGLTPNVYRFSPVPFTEESMRQMHGVDERIAIPDYLESIRFYAQLAVNLNSLAPLTPASRGR